MTSIRATCLTIVALSSASTPAARDETVFSAGELDPDSGGIEDVASNAPLVVDRLSRMVDNLYYFVGTELMHAAQAVDLRRRATPTIALGLDTYRLYEAFRGVAPFLDRDRPLTDDISKSHDYLLGSDAVQQPRSPSQRLTP